MQTLHMDVPNVLAASNVDVSKWMRDASTGVGSVAIRRFKFTESLRKV